MPQLSTLSAFGLGVIRRVASAPPTTWRDLMIYMSNVTPAVVVELVDEITRLRTENDELRATPQGERTKHRDAIVAALDKAIAADDAVNVLKTSDTRGPRWATARLFKERDQAARVLCEANIEDRIAFFRRVRAHLVSHA